MKVDVNNDRNIPCLQHLRYSGLKRRLGSSLKRFMPSLTYRSTSSNTPSFSEISTVDVEVIGLFNVFTEGCSVGAFKGDSGTASVISKTNHKQGKEKKIKVLLLILDGRCSVLVSRPRWTKKAYDVNIENCSELHTISLFCAHNMALLMPRTLVKLSSKSKLREGRGKKVCVKSLSAQEVDLLAHRLCNAYLAREHADSTLILEIKFHLRKLQYYTAGAA